MKLINYAYGYFTTFDCVIHGKIVMTADELEEVKKYLLKLKGGKLWNKETLKKDFNRILPRKLGEGYYINIRTTATALMANRFGLKRYKPGNYVLHIIN